MNITITIIEKFSLLIIIIIIKKYYYHNFFSQIRIIFLEDIFNVSLI